MSDSEDETTDQQLKIVILGDGSSGKVNISSNNLLSLWFNFLLELN